MITIEQHKGVNVLRDDLLTGGTKYFNAFNNWR